MRDDPGYDEYLQQRAEDEEAAWRDSESRRGIYENEAAIAEAEAKIDDKPLHVRVAEALGWTDLVIDFGTRWRGRPAAGLSGIRYANGSDCGHISYAENGVPRYDTDWSATGPLIEKYRLVVMLNSPDGWMAVAPVSGYTGSVEGATPLLAVCHLILALSEAGKLRA